MTVPLVLKHGHKLPRQAIPSQAAYYATLFRTKKLIILSLYLNGWPASGALGLFHRFTVMRWNGMR